MRSAYPPLRDCHSREGGNDSNMNVSLNEFLTSRRQKLQNFRLKIQDLAYQLSLLMAMGLISLDRWADFLY
jgi:hypothetical protein